MNPVSGTFIEYKFLLSALKQEFGLSCERVHMLGRNSQCEKRNFFRNNGFKCSKSIENGRIKSKSTLSSCNVSPFYNKTYKNCIKCKNNLSYNLRDNGRRGKRVLYDIEKLVFYYFKLASSQYEETTSSTLEIKQNLIIETFNRLYSTSLTIKTILTAILTVILTVIPTLNTLYDKNRSVKSQGCTSLTIALFSCQRRQRLRQRRQHCQCRQSRDDQKLSVKSPPNARHNVTCQQRRHNQSGHRLVHTRINHQSTSTLPLLPIHLFINHLITISRNKCLSVESVAQAKSCLSGLSIIISDCQSLNHPSYLWSHCLSFTTLEPRLKSHRDSRGTQILPYWVSTINVLNVKPVTITISKIIKYNTLNTIFISKNLLNSNVIKYLIKIGIANIIGDWVRRLINLSGDVELNPGPIDVTFGTLNCRGLKNKNKYNQLVNRIHCTQFGTTSLIFAMQETHIEHNSLKFNWKGNHIFTEGCGNKGGLITLLSDNMIVLEELHLEYEAQISLVEILEHKLKIKLIIVNLHSPCSHDENKTNFFKEIKQKITDLLSKHVDARVIILGDFNTTFKDEERNGTIRSISEKKIANRIDRYFSDLGLKDCWEGNERSMTWRHGSKMSRLDRIKWSQDLGYRCNVNIDTDWTFTQSDHCAVIVQLKPPRVPTYDRVVRLDTFFMGNVLLKHKFLTELGQRMDQTKETNMNPHQILEFLKVNIRSIAIEISSNYKKEREAEMNTLRHEINFWQSSVENAVSESFRDLAVTRLDESICKRNEFLNKKGEFLSNRLQTKWYQEGERGTKYFLNMQRSKGKKLEMSSLKDGSEIIDDAKVIDQTVMEFYRKLYEKGDCKKCNAGSIDSFLRNMPPVDDISLNKINHPITINDLLNTLNSCKDSAPGPDGIP